MPFGQLVEEILANSEAKDWNNARKEWTLDGVQEADDDEEVHSCVCGHSPIKELCLLRNLKNQATMIVGNCCVKHFSPELKTERIFRGFDEMRKNKIPTLDALDYYFDQGWFTEWEIKLLKGIKGKRRISEKQQKKKAEALASALKLASQTTTKHFAGKIDQSDKVPSG